MNGNQTPSIPTFGDSDGTPPLDRSLEVPRRALYPIEEAAILLGDVSTKFVEYLIAARKGQPPRLESVKLGRRRLIPATAIAQLVEILKEEARQARSGS